MRVLELLREKKNGSVTYDEALSQLCDLYLDKYDPLKRPERVLRKNKKLEVAGKLKESLEFNFEKKSEVETKTKTNAEAMTDADANTKSNNKAEANLREGANSNTHLKLESEQNSISTLPMSISLDSENLPDDLHREPLFEVFKKFEISKLHENHSIPSSSSAFAQLKKNKRKALPAILKHQVWLRDQGQCRLHRNGQRCAQRVYLEIHHKIPVSRGGKDVLENLALICADHHQSLHEK